MHDPSTVAFEIKLPLPWKRPRFGGLSKGKEWASYHAATIWHEDPCKGPGGDDSCGWFMRAHHGNKEVLERIVKKFEFDWDRVFEPKHEEHDPDDGEFIHKTYFCGLFKPSGDPHLSVHAIVLNLFFMAAMEVFESDGRTNWKRAKRFMKKHLLDILLFAENPMDSLFDGITRKFEKGCGEEYGTRQREERIRNLASCIYGWILRAERPWYRHPRWHIHHWRLQLPIWQSFKRFAFDRCDKCGKGFKWGEVVIGDWNGTRIWHDACDSAKIQIKDAHANRD